MDEREVWPPRPIMVYDGDQWCPAQLLRWRTHPGLRQYLVQTRAAEYEPSPELIGSTPARSGPVRAVTRRVHGVGRITLDSAGSPPQSATPGAEALLRVELSRARAEFGHRRAAADGGGTGHARRQLCQVSSGTHRG